MWNTQGGGPEQEEFEARESERLSSTAPVTVTVPTDSPASPMNERYAGCTLGPEYYHIGAVGWLFVQLRNLYLPKATMSAPARSGLRLLYSTARYSPSDHRH